MTFEEALQKYEEEAVEYGRMQAKYPPGQGILGDQSAQVTRAKREVLGKVLGSGLAPARVAIFNAILSGHVAKFGSGVCNRNMMQSIAIAADQALEVLHGEG